MGCDIHLYTEMKVIRKEVEKWVLADYLVSNPYYGVGDWEEKYDIIRCYGDRNYTLFGVLSDVRNYSENEVMPHGEGVPDDCCEEYKKIVDGYGCDGHTHSYSTYDKIFDYLNDKKIVKCIGMVTTQQAKDWTEKGIAPDSWCRHTNDKDYVEIEWTDTVDFEHFLNALDKKYREALTDILSVWPFSDRFDEEYEKHKKDFRILWFFDN